MAFPVMCSTPTLSRNTTFHKCIVVRLSPSSLVLWVNENVFLFWLFLCARTADCEIITKSESPRSDFRIQDELFVQLTCNRGAWKPWNNFDKLSTKCLKHFSLKNYQKNIKKLELIKINFCFIDLTLNSGFISIRQHYVTVSEAFKRNNTINLKQY